MDKVSHPLVGSEDPQHAFSIEDLEGLNDLLHNGDLNYEDYEQAFDSYYDRYVDSDGDSAIIST